MVIIVVNTILIKILNIIFSFHQIILFTFCKTVVKMTNYSNQFNLIIQLNKDKLQL